MKNLTISALFAMFLTACGSGDSNSSLPFGDIPRIVVATNLEREALTEQGPDYVKAANKIIEKGEAKARAQIEGLIGRPVPISNDSDSPFEVQKAVVSRIDLKNDGSRMNPNLNCSIEVVFEVAAKGEMTQQANNLNTAALYYLIFNDQDQAIGAGSFNPMLDKQWVVRGQQIKQSLRATELCNDSGTTLTFNCHSKDYSGLSEIIFVSETDYNQITKGGF